MELLTAEQMRAVDRNAIEKFGIPGVVLMENAGRAAAAEIDEDAREVFPGPVLVLAGKGNNGGDGYVVARILADRGWQVRTLVLAEEEAIGGDAGRMLAILRNLGGELRFLTSEAELRHEFAEVSPLLIVDALFGTGLAQELSGLFATAVELVNREPALVVALDIPSGVNGSDGRIMGTAVEADLTLAFDRAKIGHGSRPGAEKIGELRVLEIGIPAADRPQGAEDCRLVDFDEAAKLLPPRPASGHKGSFGHLGLIAGSTGMSGAAALCGNAGLRSGAGLVTLVCPAALHDILEVKLTEVMTQPLSGGLGWLGRDNCAEIEEFVRGWQALVIGPGLGQNPQTVEAVRQVVANCRTALVIDADGLNALVGSLALLPKGSAPVPVLTPHPGEFSRLCGVSVAAIEADRYRVARQFAMAHRVVLVLKGARTLVADPEGRVRINTSGNVGLASGGSGDLLSGLIGGLLAQGLSPFEAATLGVWLHGAAADLVAEEIGTSGMAAGDLLRYFPVARQQLLLSQKSKR